MNRYDGESWEVPQQIRLVADIGSYKVTPAKEFQTTLSQHIRERDQILWLTDAVPDDEFIEGAAFEEKAEWRRGREDSVQGVFFGYIALGNTIETPVAIKPFFSATSTGAHETAMLMYLQDAGLPVYSVLGAAWSEDQGYAMITAFEEESRSLDNVNWKKGLNQPLGAHLTNLEAIEQVGQSLGLMHGNGIVHNDAQIKNFAVNGERVVLIDLAAARAVVSDGYVDEAYFRRGIFRDFGRLIDSLRQKKFLGDASRAQVGSFIKNVIAPAYRSGLFIANGVMEENVDNYHEIVEQTISDTLEQFDS